MKSLVLYYSNKGSNKFLAEKISKQFNCDIAQLKPRVNGLLFNVANLKLGNKAIKQDVKDYDRIILCGPIYMGKFISPLSNFVSKHKNDIKKLVFISCCGSPYEKKDDKFGHANVFKKVEEILGDKCEFCRAFPVDLIVPEDMKGNDDNYMKFHLNENNFKGEVVEVFNEMMERLKQ